VPLDSEAPHANVTATPEIVISVVVNGQRQIYDIRSAKALRDELDRAINQLGKNTQTKDVRTP